MACTPLRFFLFISYLAFALGIDVRVLSSANFRFSRDDAIDENDLTKQLGDDKATRFIGDLTIGERRSYETVFRRTIEVSNPTADVYRTAISLSVDSGIIHYVSVLNVPGSYAVACDEPYSLGGSTSGFNLRVMPNSKSTLTLVIAAH